MELTLEQALAIVGVLLVIMFGGWAWVIAITPQPEYITNLLAHKEEK